MHVPDTTPAYLLQHLAVLLEGSLENGQRTRPANATAACVAGAQDKLHKSWRQTSSAGTGMHFERQHAPGNRGSRLFRGLKVPSGSCCAIVWHAQQYRRIWHSTPAALL